MGANRKIFIRENEFALGYNSAKIYFEGSPTELAKTKNSVRYKDV